MSLWFRFHDFCESEICPVLLWDVGSLVWDAADSGAVLLIAPSTNPPCAVSLPQGSCLLCSGSLAALHWQVHFCPAGIRGRSCELDRQQILGWLGGGGYALDGLWTLYPGSCTALPWGSTSLKQAPPRFSVIILSRLGRGRHAGHTAYGSDYILHFIYENKAGNRKTMDICL